MSKKKKVFIIAYVIILIAIATFMLNKIFAGSSSSESNKTVDMGTGVGKKLEDTESVSSIPGSTLGDIDFSQAGNENSIKTWAKRKITWELLIGNNDVFCFDKTKRMLNMNNVTNQYIRKVSSVSMIGHKNGDDYVTVGLEDKVYPTNGTTWLSWIDNATYASLVFNWDKLAVIRQTQEDFGIGAAYVFAHRNEYTNKSDGTYTDAQHALWAVITGKNEADNDNDANADGTSLGQELKTYNDNLKTQQANLNSIITKNINKSLNDIDINIGYFTGNITNEEYKKSTEKNIENAKKSINKIITILNKTDKLTAEDKKIIEDEIKTINNIRGSINMAPPGTFNDPDNFKYPDEYRAKAIAQLDSILTQIEEGTKVKDSIDEINKNIEDCNNKLKNLGSANELIAKALAFQEYRESFVTPSLVSSNSKYKFKYVRNGDYFIAGPVTINYTALETSAGETVGEVLADSLNLTGIDANGKKIEKIACEVTDESGNAKEFATEGGIFEFYIKLNNSEVKNKKIKKIVDYTIKFKYMNIIANGYKIYDPKGEVLEYYRWNRCVGHNNCYVEHKPDEDGNTSTSYVSNTRVNCPYTYYCQSCKEYHTVHHDFVYRLERQSSPSSYAELQPIFICGDAKIFWEFYELKITFEDGRTDIDIGGRVWIDKPNGTKENEENGIYDEGQFGEYGRPNVLVKLYFWDGTQVQVGKNGVIADKNNSFTGPYEMYTDDEGKYKFYGLPIDQKYYVEFTYDGQTYERVEYLAGGDETDYLDNPNQEKYDNNSKVEEENDRIGFNNRFATITYKDLGQRTQIDGQAGTLGRASGVSKDLKYLSKDSDNYIRSILKTTNRNEDTETDMQTGKAEDPFKITARTGKNLQYPFEKDGEILIWSVEDKDKEGNALHYLDHVNLGLRVREKADFALLTQLKAGAMTIKDKQKVVFYAQNSRKDELKLTGTKVQDEYIKQEISATDYHWKENFNKIYDGQKTYFTLTDDKLNVYVLYKIEVYDQCENANDYGVISELIDHYDNRLERVPEADRVRVSKLFNVKGMNVPEGSDSWIEGTDTPVIWNETSPVDGNYTTMKTNGLNLVVGKGDTSSSAVYLILKVKENGEVLYKGDEGNKPGIQNIAEIGTYTVYDGNDAIAGKIDKDSAPGNAIPGNNDTYEDDTDPAPIFKLILNWAPRKIEGIVWDDATNFGVNDGEKGVENVTVKLVEYYMGSDGEIKSIERPGIEINGNTLSVEKGQNVKTNADGHYEFYVEGGNYALKFIYGDKEMLLTNKVYNAQDYQATKPYNALSSGSVTGYNQTIQNAFANSNDLKYAIDNDLVLSKLVTDDIEIIDQDNALSKWETANWRNDTTNNVSSARDDARIRANIIENANSLQYSNADLLDKLNSDRELTNEDAQKLSDDYTRMEANTDIITVASNDLVGTSKVINLGLKERPKAIRTLEKKVKRIVLRTNDGTALVDTDDTSKLSGVQLLEDIQSTYINMDANKLDGATLDIDYEIIVKNASTENDKYSNYVYIDSDKNDLSRLGDLDTPLPIRTTIYDYVNINLEYRADDNVVTEGTSGWERVNEANGNYSIPDGWISEEVKGMLPRDQKHVSRVLTTKTKDLLAGESITIPIHLGVTLSENTGKNDSNDFDFSNCAEIVQIDSPAGRRDYETVPGNYVPYEDVNEPDEFETGRTSISPPLGQARIYYVITIVSATILIAGIILIKKKVLKK